MPSLGAVGQLFTRKAFHPVILDEGHAPCLPKLLYLMANVNAYTSHGVNQRYDTFCRKEYLGRGAHWLNTWGLSSFLISMGNSRFSCYYDQLSWSSSWGAMVICSRSGSWEKDLASRIPGVLKSEVPQGLGLFNPTSSSVWWHRPLAPQGHLSCASFQEMH